MFGFLITGLLVTASFAEKVRLNGDSNIYDAIVSSLKELKAQQIAEEKDLYRFPSIIQRATSVCYDELGCFDKNGTFKHLKQLPDPPETVNTKFLLFTRKNILEPQFIDYKKEETITKSHFNHKGPIKFMTHGFGGQYNMTWIWAMKTAFLKREDCNVIVIDWSLGAKVPYYIQAAVNTELVGAEAAVLFFVLQDKYGVKEKDLHVVGFSLGAHVAGFVGKRMQELRDIKPGRITGLDPASPLFEEYGGEVHLYKDDADYVDVVHTNADYLMYGGVGIEKPIGHVDYYPNGGRRQPGCKSTLKGAFKDIIKNERDRVCNHERAVHLFTDTILNESPCDFTAYRCENYTEFQLGKCMSCDEQCGRMGYQSHGSGVYYLMTKAKKPYCAGLAKLKVNLPNDVKKSYGSLILTFIGKSGNKQNVTLTEKDEKLTPGAEIVQALPISDIIEELISIQALYIRYNGWITKGADTYGLASVTLEDTKSQLIYKSCGDTVILKDKVFETLKQTAGNC